MCKFFFNDLLLCLHCRTRKHTHGSICSSSSSSFHPSLTYPSLSYPYPYPSFLVAIPFGYSCSRPLPTCAVHECKSLSLFFLFFIFYFFCRVCVLFFCCSLLAARCVAVPNIPLYPFISVAQYLYPSACPSVCVFVYLCVTCRQRM